MISQTMTMESHLSHISARVSRLYGRFNLMPFQFFGEKEIHYEFYKELNELRKTDSRYKELKIIREFPTSSFYKRSRDGFLVDIPDGKKAYIDLVIKHPSGDFGFEFYFGKETPYIEKSYYQDILFLRNRTLSPMEALIHTENDCLKLKKEPSLIFSFVILFIASYHKNSDTMEYFKINKREKIIQGLRKIREKTPENIRILYMEKSYVNDLNNGEWTSLQF